MQTLLLHFNKHKTKNKMKDFLFKKLPFTLGIAFFLFSCSNNDEPKNNNGDSWQDAIALTYTVGEETADSVFTRSTSGNPIVERQTFMGMEVETAIYDETIDIKKGSQTSRATVYNTVNLNGKKVYAIVFDPTTNKILGPLQTLTVTGNQITVKAFRGSKVLFYIGREPSITQGGDITTTKVLENSGSPCDAMQCFSPVITSTSNGLGTLTFKHVFTKLRIKLKTSNGTVVNAFSLKTNQINQSHARVKIFDRSYTIEGTLNHCTFSVSNNTTSEAVSAYQDIIIANSNTATELNLYFDTQGKGVTIDGAKNYLTTVNNTLKLYPRILKPGHRYSINITVNPTNIDQYLNTGFKADRRYYQWDAYEPNGVGDSLVWSPGNSGFRRHTPAENDKDIASQSCKNCPTYNQICMYLGAGVLADDGHTGPNQPSYTITNPITGEKRTYHAGVWFKKKQYIAGFAEGTAPKATQANGKGRPSPETINQYFFLPFYGWREYTNGWKNSFSFDHSGVDGFYHSKTAYKYNFPTNYHINSIRIDANGAAINRLNWTSNNIVAINIWTAD